MVGALSDFDYPKLSLGGTEVRLDTRLVSNGRKSERIEPKVALSLKLLAERQGKVVSRDELLQQCWPGRTVGDDSVYRIVMKIRRLAAVYGGFEVETIPKAGFRLTIVQTAVTEAAAPSRPRRRNWWKLDRLSTAAGIGFFAILLTIGAYQIHRTQGLGPARVVWDYNQGVRTDAPNGIRIWNRQSADLWQESFADGSIRSRFELISEYTMKPSGCEGVLLRRDKTLIAFVPRPSCREHTLFAEDIDSKTGVVTRPWFELGAIQENDWK